VVAGAKKKEKNFAADEIAPFFSLEMRQ